MWHIFRIFCSFFLNVRCKKKGFVFVFCFFTFLLVRKVSCVHGWCINILETKTKQKLVVQDKIFILIFWHSVAIDWSLRQKVGLNKIKIHTADSRLTEQNLLFLMSFIFINSLTLTIIKSIRHWIWLWKYQIHSKCVTYNIRYK